MSAISGCRNGKAEPFLLENRSTTAAAVLLEGQLSHMQKLAAIRHQTGHEHAYHDIITPCLLSVKYSSLRTGSTQHTMCWSKEQEMLI